MALNKSQLIIIAIAGSVLLVLVLGVIGVIPIFKPKSITGENEPEIVSVDVSVWGIFHPGNSFKNLAPPGFKIEYTDFDPEVYERALINALASGTGPDVFMVHNSWIPKHFTVMRPSSTVTPSMVSSLFPEVVRQDFAPTGVVYALPLYLDTLAMFYNKDIFDNASIVFPPSDWEELQRAVVKTKNIDTRNQIQTAGAALGGSEQSINRASDIISLFLMQGNAEMVNSDLTRARFADSEGGINAFQYYMQYGDPASQYYTWSNSSANSIDAFADGKVAMMFNYAFQAEVLKEKNPFLRYGIAPMPQPVGSDQRVDYANYWGLAVSSQTANPGGAWDYVAKMTTGERVVGNYTNTTDRPPALKSIINLLLNDPAWGVFARQALTARSWLQIDNTLVEQSLSRAAENVLSGRSTITDSLKRAQAEITGEMRKHTDKIRKFLGKE